MKALALRLQKVVSNLVNSDQVGYIKIRYIGKSIRTIFDLLNFTKINNIEAYITQINFEKNPFYSLEWPFMLKTFKKFNLEENGPVLAVTSNKTLNLVVNLWNTTH